MSRLPEATDTATAAPRSPRTRPDRLARLRRLGGGRLQRTCLLLLVLFALIALLGPWIAPQDPTFGHLGDTLLGPSAAHWLGTDQGGHDTFSALLVGTRTSLAGPLAVVLFSTALGVAVGLFTAWRGGWIDTAVGRVLDVLFAFPALLLAILAVALFGKGMTAPVLAMAIAYMPYTARLVRGLAVQEKSRPYIAAYRVQGHSALYVMVRRLLPNIAPTLLAQSTVNFGYALLDLAALSFLGLGVQPPTPDWGAMINQGQAAVLQGQPLSAIAPAVAVVLVVVAFNVVGEDLGDRLAGRDS
ncbi:MULTISPECIES: ABC transporter permease [unclassified Streptomyces]|uniref:ABC transporter permease n=1 Tax=unclassified Streptomyces TaxID=2593676 RepID=UPI000DC7A6F6|nr:MULTISPECIES: ABC transporter permease [unclassified Streptomyces]AWZ09140.1 ABC transporter permease [Streptomyces sp. ICC4]AWZ16359.1 ABC transporter permease [Streptomyces sp. ICC1]